LFLASGDLLFVAARILFLSAAALAILCGCKPSADDAGSSGRPIRVADFYRPGTYWIGIAVAKGWFREAGLNVQLVYYKGDDFDSAKDLVEGRLDIATFGMLDLLDSIAHGADLVAIVNADYSAGAEKLIARPGIDNLPGLKGKKIAVSRNSYFAYILDVALGRVGLKTEDVQIADIRPEKAGEALIKGEVDAMLTFEPHATRGLEAIKGRDLFDTSQTPGLSPTLIVLKRKFIEERGDDATAFVKVWQRATTFIKEHPDEAFGIIALMNKKTPAEIRLNAKLYKILDLRDNEQAFSFAAGFDSLYGAVRQVNDYMIARGITDKKLDSSHFLEGSFIRSLK
jgi:NitT/TauT family transport system substrate-binding protein